MSAGLRLVRWADDDRAAMRALSGALRRLARSVAISERQSAEPIARTPVSPPEEPTEREKAHALLHQRRDRDAAFGRHARLFAEPAWDMLLALFIGHGEAGAVTVAELVAANPGSGEHWLRALEADGLALRWSNLGTEPNGGDLVEITREGLALMARYLARV